MDGLLGVTILMIFLVLLFMVWGVAEYVLHSLGLYKIALKRQVPNAWLAWIPFGTNWIVGKIAEKCDERDGINRKWGILLLVSELITVVSVIFFLIIYFAFIFIMIGKYEYTEPPIGSFLIFFLFILIFALIMSGVSMVFAGCQILCVYKIFEFCVPEKTLKYWLFYLLIPIVGNLCLVKCGNIEYPVPQESMWDEGVPMDAESTDDVEEWTE